MNRRIIIPQKQSKDYNDINSTKDDFNIIIRNIIMKFQKYYYYYTLYYVYPRHIKLRSNISNNYYTIISIIVLRSILIHNSTDHHYWCVGVSVFSVFIIYIILYSYLFFYTSFSMFSLNYKIIVYWYIRVVRRLEDDVMLFCSI